MLTTWLSRGRHLTNLVNLQIQQFGQEASASSGSDRDKVVVVEAGEGETVRVRAHAFSRYEVSEDASEARIKRARVT